MNASNMVEEVVLFFQGNQLAWRLTDTHGKQWWTEALNHVLEKVSRDHGWCDMGVVAFDPFFFIGYYFREVPRTDSTRELAKTQREWVEVLKEMIAEAKKGDEWHEGHEGA